MGRYYLDNNTLGFYAFCQNNSGGYFETSANVAHTVYIEAENWEHANTRAEEIGIYFDGVSAGLDCRCCGDRWYDMWRTDTPIHLVNTIEEHARERVGGMFSKEARVHYLNGEVKSFE